MDSAPNLELVVQAITSLYHNPDTKQKEEASKWLQSLQKSVYAWKISDELLHRKLDVESCYFAAQTMRSKIQYSFSELPPEAHSSLRDSLLEHVSAVTPTTSNVIVTQLCLAVADLILLMPDWKNAVQDLLARLGQTQVTTLLEILVFLPEEVDSRYLRLGANRRQQIKDDLTAASPAVTQFLQSCVANITGAGDSNPSHNIQVTVIKCYSSWLTLGVISLSQLQATGVMGVAVSALGNPSSSPFLHEAAADCLIALLVMLERADRAEAEQLEESICAVVKRLEEPYHIAVADEDMDKCLNYCRVFTELAETFLIKIVSQSGPRPHFALPILDTVLICCGHPDYEMPDVTFNLWYRLSEEVYTRNDDNLVNMFKPHIERLIVSLCRHCQMEPDTIGCLEDGEDFAEFRNRVSELIKDCVFIVGSSSVFKQMFMQLQQAKQWEQTEAALFIMQAVARNLLPDENEVVPQVLQQVLALPETMHVAVRQTALRLVGELCEWIDKHPSILQDVLNWLLGGLQNTKMSSEAATALQNICSQCRQQMTEHFSGLIHILESLDSFGLKPEAANGLIKGVVNIMSIMQPDQIREAMKKVIALQLAPLTAIMDVPRQTKIVKHSLQDPVLYLDRLSAILRHISPDLAPGASHPCKEAVELLWPVVSRCCDIYCEDVRVTERACRTIRFAVRCIGIQSANMLQPLVQQMIKLYGTQNHSCYLYLGSILVDEYANEVGCIPGLLGMLQSFINPTYGVLAAAGGLRDHPDTVDDFFRLNARFLQRAALPYLQTEFLKSILECALLSAGLEHRDANASVMKFFYDLLHAGRTGEERPDFEARSLLIRGLHGEYGCKLVDVLIRAAVLSLPSYTYHDVGDVLYESMLYDRASVCTWLETTLKSLPAGTNDSNINSAAQVTTKQLVDFHRSVTSAEKASDVAHAIREFSRLWR